MRSALAAAVLLVAPPVLAGTVTGRVQLVEKGGRAANLSEVVVYLDGIKARPQPARVVMAMKNKAFTPRVAVVPVGGTVEFPNQDPIFHNVFSVSGQNRFDLNLYKRPKSGAWTFQSPGVARVYCNIHPQMSAVVMVRDNPHFARATAEGTFVLEHVPAGTHTLKAWHDRAGEVAVPLTVPAQGQVSADLVLDASHYKRIQHKRKDGTDYFSGERY